MEQWSINTTLLLQIYIFDNSDFSRTSSQSFVDTHKPLPYNQLADFFLWPKKHYFNIFLYLKKPCYIDSHLSSFVTLAIFRESNSDLLFVTCLIFGRLRSEKIKHFLSKISHQIAFMCSFTKCPWLPYQQNCFSI